MRTPKYTRLPRSSGFTLIELLLVLVILSVLAVVVVPKFTGRSEQAKQTAAKADIATLKAALERFELDAGRYPTTDEGLSALVTQPGSVTKWFQQIDKLPTDPWQNPYNYRYPGQHNTNSYDLWSNGADGREGGTDDVDNWSQPTK
jgi:general secretion pathway protein G